MLDIQKTVYSTLVDKLGKLRYQAKDDPKAFKNILTVIMLSDICEWSKTVYMPKEVIDKLERMLKNRILCDSNFILEHSQEEDDYYTNVNTPQTSDTWKRVWDFPGTVIELDKEFLKGDNGFVYPDAKYIVVELGGLAPLIQEEL